MNILRITLIVSLSVHAMALCTDAFASEGGQSPNLSAEKSEQGALHGARVDARSRAVQGFSRTSRMSVRKGMRRHGRTALARKYIKS